MVDPFSLTITCAACTALGEQPPRSFMGSPAAAAANGWAEWVDREGPMHWICDRCWDVRPKEDFVRLWGEPVRVEAQRLDTPTARAVANKSLPGQAFLSRYPSLDTYITELTRREERVTQLQFASAPRPTAASDAPEPRLPAPKSVPYGAPAETVARKLLGVEVVRELGRGAMATVYEVRAPDGNRYAAKILAQNLMEDPVLNERFRREAMVLDRLNHPNIVRLHEYREHSGIHCFLMELVDGVTLRKVIGIGPMALTRGIEVARAVCDGVEHAHAQQVVHRDIKPENILVDQDGQPKVADFGIAKLSREHPGMFTLTRQGDSMGTPVYMAPEQRVAPEEVDQRADIYSVGVMLYEMLTGCRPKPPGDDGLLRFDPINPRVDAIIRQATAPVPNMRIPSARLLAEQLLAAQLGA